MIQNADFVIIGAGIVGLTVALELRKRHKTDSIVIIEKESSVGLHASGRNSGVLHSGVYYGNDTIKAKVCSSGSKKMQEFADEHSINYRKSGKVIIATSEADLLIIDKLLVNARNNNINVERLDEYDIRKIEPYSNPYQYGLYSPDTAVIDSYSVVEKLFSILQDKKVEFKLNSSLLKVNDQKNTILTSKEEISYGYLYNCAGANADRVAKLFKRGLDYTMIPFKGIYYKLDPRKNHLVNSNIYPTPDVNLPFLGVHLTKVINGDIYVGPTAIPAFGRENYGILKGLKLSEAAGISFELLNMYLKNVENFRSLVHSETRKYIKPWFLESAQRLVPSLQSEDLVSSNKVGIRPQLVNIKTKSIEMDYIIEKTENSTHVLNSISPAFTSSVSFAEFIINCSEE